jgi:hypothetical protein
MELVATSITHLQSPCLSARLVHLLGRIHQLVLRHHDR